MNNENEVNQLPQPTPAPLQPAQPNPKSHLPIILSVLAVIIAAGVFTFYYKSKDKNFEAISSLDSSPLSSEEERLKVEINSISKEEYLKHGGSITETAEPRHAECKEAYNSEVADKCEEKFQLLKYPSVKRESDVCLSIILKNGSSHRLCNSGEHGDYRGYTLKGYIPNLGYWFNIQYYEGGGNLIINEKTGEEMEVLGKPVWSPKKDKFITAAVELSEAGYNPNGFQIWEKSGDSYILTLERTSWKSDIDYAIINPVWVSNDLIYFYRKWLQFTEIPWEPTPGTKLTRTEITIEEDYASLSLDQFDK